MKKALFILIFALIPFIAKSQFTSDLLVFNRTGEPFKLLIGSQTVNNYFSSKVRANDLQSGNYTLTIIFQNTNVPNLNINVFIQQNSELACVLNVNSKGLYYTEVFEVISYVNQSNISPNIQPLPPEPMPVGNHFCQIPMEQVDFENALSTIKNQDFDGDRLTVAKQIAGSNCMLAEQIKQILFLFDFENNRLEFAKYAYTHCFDPSNYFVVNEAFDYSSNITKLNEYIDSL